MTPSHFRATRGSRKGETGYHHDTDAPHMKERLSKRFWQDVKKTFHEALAGPPNATPAAAEGQPTASSAQTPHLCPSAALTPSHVPQCSDRTCALASHASEGSNLGYATIYGFGVRGLVLAFPACTSAHLGCRDADGCLKSKPTLYFESMTGTIPVWDATTEYKGPNEDSRNVVTGGTGSC